MGIGHLAITLTQGVLASQMSSQHVQCFVPVIFKRK